MAPDTLLNFNALNANNTVTTVKKNQVNVINGTGFGIPALTDGGNRTIKFGLKVLF